MDIARKVYPGVLDVSYELNWVEVKAGERLSVEGLELDALGMKHDVRLSATLGFIARLDGRRFAYTGDTAMCPAVLDMARHAEVLVSECASRAAGSTST